MVRIHSNLPLQMCLYYHAYYSIVFYVFTLALFIAKTQLLLLLLEMIFTLVALRRFIIVSGVRFSLYFNKDGTLYQPSTEENEEAAVNEKREVIEMRDEIPTGDREEGESSSDTESEIEN